MFGFRREPVAIVLFLSTVIACLQSFGVPITQDQQATLIAVANAGLALFLRSQVTSEHTLHKAGTDSDEVHAVAGDITRVMTPSAAPTR